MRLDLLLVEKKLVVSRSHAQELIEAGQVFSIENGQKKCLKKASLNVSEQIEIEITQGPANRFVSRGGLKLEGALRHLKWDVAGLDVLDVGISTGGFSDCLLQLAARSVFGVDVGHGQLSLRLQNNKKLKVKEGVNARTLSKDVEVSAIQYDLIVMDVSFISITLILPELAGLLREDGKFLSLVKPQFEVGAQGLGKGGIVKDTSLYFEVESKIKKSCGDHGFLVEDYFESSIVGKEGNREFFVSAKKLS